MKTYRLGSSPLVYAPGVLAWAIGGYWKKSDRKHLRSVVTGTWSGLPDDVADRVLKKELAYSIEGETVVITA